jgi:pimeloyl-ACP methyl ester carboxylesterase
VPRCDEPEASSSGSASVTSRLTKSRSFTQILLDRGLGAAGVAIDSGPVKGLLALPASTLKTGFPVLKNPSNNHRAVPLTREEFPYAFTNTLTDEESAAVYERYAVPGPGRVLFQGAFANFNPRSPAAVDFKNSSRAPLLFIAGGDDHVAPASLNASNLKHYRNSGRSPSSRSFPAARTTRSAKRAGRKSRTTRSTGP